MRPAARIVSVTKASGMAQRRVPTRHKSHFCSMDFTMEMPTFAQPTPALPRIR
ncbi:MAG TPA: hypothetical protein VGG57_15410 [Stellaceae bacterium]